MERDRRGGGARGGPESLGARLRRLRASREMSQNELARRIGRHQTVIGPYERDEYAPPRGILERLAAALGTTPEYLSFGREAGFIGLPLVGRVGPGGILGGENEREAAPRFQLHAERLAAVAIADDSMAPVLRAGQVALVPAGPGTDPTALLGRDVLARLDDARVLLRRLLPSADRDSFDLAAYAAPTLRRVRVLDARPVVGVVWPVVAEGTEPVE